MAILATARARHVLIKCHTVSEIRSTGDDTVSGVAVGITIVCIVVCGNYYHIQTLEPTHLNVLLSPDPYLPMPEKLHTKLPGWSK
jgi:hypothetical protein